MKHTKIILIIVPIILLVCFTFFLVKTMIKSTKYDASGNLIENVYIKNINGAIYDNNLSKVKKLSDGKNLNQVYVNEKCDDGENWEESYDCLPPLSVAVRIGRYEIAEYLIKNGANVNYSDIYTNYTPLLFALEDTPQDNQYKMLQLLLTHNASMNVKNHFGNTPLEIIASEYIIDSKEGKEKEKLNLKKFKLLIQYDETPNNEDYITSLKKLAEKNNNNLISEYLQTM